MVRLHFPEYYRGFLFLDVVFTKSVSYHHSSNSFDLNCNELVSESHHLKHSDKKRQVVPFQILDKIIYFPFAVGSASLILIYIQKFTAAQILNQDPVHLLCYVWSLLKYLDCNRNNSAGLQIKSKTNNITICVCCFVLCFLNLSQPISFKSHE